MAEREKIFPVILAGGFGVRTQGILEGKPKALIKSSDGKTLLEHLLCDLEKSGFESALIVSNHKFYDKFLDHLKELGEKDLKISTTLINNGVDDPEKRLGALGDFLFGVESPNLESWNGSFLVLSSDYAYWKAFKIGDFIEFANKAENRDCFLTVVRDTGDPAVIKGRFGCPEVDENGLIISFEEKPENPKGTLAILAFYLFRPIHVNSLKEFKGEGGNLDSPSNIIPYFLKKGVRASVFIVGNEAVDAGTPQEIDKARNY